MVIRFSHDAREDIQDISDYTLEVWGDEQETAYLLAIDAKLKEISGDPERWPFRNDLFEGCQTALVGKHLIFFVVDENVVHVSRVLHQAMDVPRHAFPL